MFGRRRELVILPADPASPAHLAEFGKRLPQGCIDHLRRSDEDGIQDQTARSRVLAGQSVQECLHGAALKVAGLAFDAYVVRLDDATLDEDDLKEPVSGVPAPGPEQLDELAWRQLRNRRHARPE